MLVVVMFGSRNKVVAEEGEEDGRWRWWLSPACSGGGAAGVGLRWRISNRSGGGLAIDGGDR
jgi:hypothetical protein